MVRKSLDEMAAEVDKYCSEMGWREQEVPFPQAMALLHEEVAEAGHAWRDWGLTDATVGVTAEQPRGHWRAKPEGVGSELADVLIRLLDDSVLFGLNLPALAAGMHGRFAFGDESQFLVHVNTLHMLIAMASGAWEAGDDPAPCLAKVLAYLMQLARHYGINILFEYERKMSYNRTRPYRHGGKRA